MPKLTKRVVESITPTIRVQVVWDSQLPGFGIRVRASGKRVYFVQYRTHHNRQRKQNIGQHGVLTAEQARAEAQQWLADIARGIDPAKKTPVGTTMADLSERYLREHASIKKKAQSIRSDEQLLRMHILPRFGTYLVLDLTRADVASLHYDLHATPWTANRTLALLSKMCTLAEQWGYRPDNSNPVRHIERYKEPPRERFLSPAELSRLGDALLEAERTQSQPAFAIAAIRLLIFTGARRGEILSLQWEHVDLDSACLRLPDSKTGAKTIFLAEPALEILRNLPRHPDSSSVFPSSKTEGTITLNHIWPYVCANADLPDVRLHDLRHSFASFGAGLGVSLPILGKMLGHTQASTTQRYAHLAADPVREAVDRIGGG